MALESGQGYSDINYDDIPFGDMDDHLVLEDVPVLPEIAMPIIVVDPEFPEVSEFSVMDMLDQDIVVPSMP